MAARLLTKKFLSYTVGKWEKRNNKGVIDLLDVGKLELNKMAEVITLGITRGKNESDEDITQRAYDAIDNFLDNEDKGIIDLFLQIIREYDMDFKILKAAGMNIEQLEEDLKSGLNDSVSNTKDNVITLNSVKETTEDEDMTEE